MRATALLLLAVLPVMACLAMPGAAFGSSAPFSSLYSSLKKCQTVESLGLPDRTIRRSDREGVVRCPGQGGFTVYIVDQDPRSWLVLERGGVRAPLQREMVGEFKLGEFPTVSEQGMMEWRLDRRKAVRGFIVRVEYQIPGSTEPASALLAFLLENGKPRLLGATTSNEKARALIDSAAR
ncbi:hypothetical protein WOC76_11800 [Methylocystis sp. IM3]|uniref:hypothetical protein n=1 Tax=unclassified Methylocystis TaxID=2625913 RepID=UPI0030F79A58